MRRTALGGAADDGEQRTSARYLECARRSVDTTKGRKGSSRLHPVGRPLARLAFLDDLAVGRFTVANLEPDDFGVVAGLERRYDDLDVGLADLGVVVVAKRYGTRRLLTFDERHFRALRPLDGGQFTLLPSDPGRSVSKPPEPFPQPTWARR